MSKYGELSELVTAKLDLNDAVEEETKKFVSKLIKELTEYLGMEPDKIVFLKYNSKVNDKSVSLEEAVELQPDNFWQFRIKVTINHKNKNKGHSWCYTFAVKPKEDNKENRSIKFMLIIIDINGTPSKEFLIDSTNKEDILTFCDFIYNSLKEAVFNFGYSL